MGKILRLWVSGVMLAAAVLTGLAVISGDVAAAGKKTAHAVGTNGADITAAKTSGKSGSAETSGKSGGAETSGKSGSAETSGKSGGAETEALGVDEGEVSGSENEAAFDYKTVSGQLEEIEKSIRKKQFTRQSLDDAAAFLTQQEIVIEFAAKGIEKNSKYVQDALNALGPEPAEGENEDPAIAEMRSKYTAVMNNYKNRLIEANLLKTEMARLNSIISEARSRIIIGNLVAEQNVLIAPHNFFTAIGDAAVFFWEIAISPVEWYRGLSAEERENVYHGGWYVLLILGLALSFGLFLRRYIINKWGYGHTEDYPRYGQKIVVAVITAIAYGVIPSLLIGGCLLWQLTNETLTQSKFGVVLANVLYYSLYVTLIRALARVTLAPWNGRWRLFNISDERAERVFAATTLSLILLGAVGCIRQIAAYFEASEALTLLLEVAGDAIKAFVIILMTSRILGRIRNRGAGDEENEEESRGDGAGGSGGSATGTAGEGTVGTGTIKGAVGSAAGGSATGSSSSATGNSGSATGTAGDGTVGTGTTKGAVGSAAGGSATGSSSTTTGNSGSTTGMAAAAASSAAVASEKIVTSAPTAGSAAALLADDEPENMSLSSKIIVFTTIFAVLTFGISLFGYPELATFIFNRFIASVLFIGAFVIVRRFISDLLRRSIVFWIKTFKLRKQLLSKADFLMTLLVTPLLVLFLIYSLLTLWGMPGAFMLQAVKKLVFGFKVGGINISLISIVTGLLVFLISLTLVKMMKNRLSNNLLNRINMDEGIKHSLISGFSFTGFIISAILAIVAMGVDLSNLAVIAGALSVGIGFGLQDVIKNLVSGIILLFERPFKVGDWVLIGGEEGKIKQINIRSTEVETFNKASVIIPNATLISSSLTNLTHGNNWQRQTIAVGVSYDSDAEQVTKLLLECARSCKKVMKVPAPYVLFKNFGESSLDFELRIYVSDIWSGWSAGSDVRYEILRRFREANINIAYPQIVVHQGSEDTSVKGWQTNV
ncbi:MAG: mechanosensitive ion channel domain-containing protein [Alphaproteobacteria bacterium]